MWKYIKIWLLNLFYRYKPAYQTEWIENLPDQLKKNTVYILGGRKYPFQTVFICPRSCGKKIYINISPQHKKKWDIIEHKNDVISLSPSIWMAHSECNCHYWLKKGKFNWVL